MSDGPFLRPAHEKVGIVKIPRVKIALGASGVDGGTQEGQIANETTAQSIAALAEAVADLTAMLYQQTPRITATRQAAVSIEAGSVGISANQDIRTVTTVTNLTNAGGLVVNAPANNMAGLTHIYDRIVIA
jgi:hypothetical protein